MRKLLLMSLLMSLTQMVFSQVSYKQVKIPLDNLKGIPFQKVEGGYHLGGFEVDNNDCMYFLGGTKTTLTVYKGSTLLYRKQYSEFSPGNLYIHDSKLYSFDCLYDRSRKGFKNNLIVLSQSDGAIFKRCNQIIKTPVNSYCFIDSSLIIEKSIANKSSNGSTYVNFNLSGTLVKQTNNAYDLPVRFFPEEYSKQGGVNFLGKWNSYHLYQSYDESAKIKFWALDSQGKQKLLKPVDTKLLGESFIETPNEFVKLRNGYIYIVGYQESNVIITKISVKDLF